jgi:hypothetical protein
MGWTGYSVRRWEPCDEKIYIDLLLSAVASGKWPKFMLFFPIRHHLLPKGFNRLKDAKFFAENHNREH